MLEVLRMLPLATELFNNASLWVGSNGYVFSDSTKNHIIDSSMLSVSNKLIEKHLNDFGSLPNTEYFGKFLNSDRFVELSTEFVKLHTEMILDLWNGKIEPMNELKNQINK